ncbi:hypothetical protein P154DRAFT_558639 [Amniculicola lignicola CBS 123094]|uniref:BTB domain-containing protein n=1 Tax=Amniculicola lignicola CBS 123094 TaxID=1392246 RepID=A0A6A5X3A6_9PLEO|nr:hypothetical protein P154DRAFT_558639 [Amniculicola lignicola CBS 123094]
MALAFIDLITSTQFTFMVRNGKEKKAVVVHSKAIAATCSYMKTLIQGNMIEAQSGCANIDDLDYDGFIRFCEYAYRGDYTVPAENCISAMFKFGTGGTRSAFGGFSGPSLKTPPKVKSDMSPFGIGTTRSGFDVTWGTPTETITKPSCELERSATNEQLRKRFENHIYPGYDLPLKSLSNRCRIKANTHPDQDFTGILLAHAHLYDFAQRHMITQLEALTLTKLHATLLRFTLYEQRISDIVELARYAYGEDIPSKEMTGTIDKLRGLVVDYIVYNINVIGRSSHFCELLQEGGEFVADFWDIMRLRY